MPDERGRYKIFLGMSAGVGKTFQMLQEGQAEAESGRDVVAGLIETHGRAETAALVGGLEILPRRRVDYRGTTLEEMDLPAILARRPELALIDELAHSNAPGVEHAKRYEDITAILAAGIDVFSTVNVQHFESLNDRVAELTGTRVRETVPDSVIAGADEIVLVDLTPEALIARLQAGKVYPRERVEAALNHFFRIENLAALREVALREVAEEVETKRRVASHRLSSAPRRPPSPPALRRRSRSACSPSSPRRRSPSASSAAPRAPPSGSTASSTCSTCGRPGASRAPGSASSSSRCGGSPPCSARTS